MVKKLPIEINQRMVFTWQWTDVRILCVDAVLGAKKDRRLTTVVNKKPFLPKWRYKKQINRTVAKNMTAYV